MDLYSNKKNKDMFTQRYFHSSYIYDSSKLEIIQMSFNRWSLLIQEYYSAIKKEWITDTHHNFKRIMLSIKAYSQKVAYCIFHLYNILESGRYSEQMCGCQELQLRGRVKG